MRKHLWVCQLVAMHIGFKSIILFILTIAISNPLCLKIFEYFFHTVFENEGLPFYWVELKTFLSMAFMFWYKLVWFTFFVKSV